MKENHITTSEIVKAFSRKTIERSGLFEVTGKGDHQGWAMTTKTKRTLQMRGHCPFNRDHDPNKRCTLWKPEVLGVVREMVEQAVAAKDEPKVATRTKSAMCVNCKHCRDVGNGCLRCVRYAPRPVVEVVSLEDLNCGGKCLQARWPDVMIHDVCGEFVASEESK